VRDRDSETQGGKEEDRESSKYKIRNIILHLESDLKL